ncbi:MAG: dihydrofolate reductase [Ferruginibacter sp.]
MISLIVAASTNNAIGKNGKLLWSLPNDMKFFKNTTWGMPIIMGRKTFEDVNEPLNGRVNIVITRNPDWKKPNTTVVSNLKDAIAEAEKTNCKEIFIIGGGEIFKESMDLADRIYITRVHATLDGDAYFPVIDDTKWDLVFNEDFPADEKHAYAYSFQTWEPHP